MKLLMKSVSSLEKVFPEYELSASLAFPMPSGFQNETLSFQVAYRLDDAQADTDRHARLRVDVLSPAAQHVRIRQVRNVPVLLPTYRDSDDNYLRKAPGLYPDLLAEIAPHSLIAQSAMWNALWVDVEPDATLAAGLYPVTLRFQSEDGAPLGEVTQHVQILPGLLPEQKLIHTKWFHADCLAQYYHVPVFGEEHWRIIESFIRKAVKGGINMILMPTHTPPLDTAIGGERLTTQLVDVYLENGRYRFDMAKARRWIALCKSCGVSYYEIAHLFTQWGAKHAPKIMAMVDGEYGQLFGWDTDATGTEYRAFLEAYLPALRTLFRQEGIDKNVRWHISDEPDESNIEHYLAAKAQVEKLLAGEIMMDALSHFAFYQRGIVEHPIVANNHMEPFLDAGVRGLWTYYCCGQYRDVSNQFIAMPSARNRILGVQLYKHNIEGFLQWGFNFYNAQHSLYPINPFVTTDCDGIFPAGDPFQVYPGPDGQPLESIRMAVTTHALQDLRAFEWLGALVGRQKVLALIEEGLSEPLSFSVYPKSAAYLLTLRDRVNGEIMGALQLSDG